MLNARAHVHMHMHMHVHVIQVDPKLAFRDEAAPWAFTEFNASGNTFKLVLAEPKPACWTAARTDKPSGFWCTPHAFPA